MATPDIYYIPPTQPNFNNPNEIKSDICYLPTAPMQPAPPPSYTAAPPSYAGPPSMYPSPQVFISQVQMPYQGILVNSNFIPPQTASIRDYMVWSIVNIFLGGVALGFIAVLLSMQTRNRKREGDVQGAKSMSNITLCCNIFITILFFALTAFLIVYITYFM
jgi:hypothetical protein